jgi:hypothetical protein
VETGGLNGFCKCIMTSKVASNPTKRIVAMFAMIEAKSKRLVTALITLDCIKKGVKVKGSGWCGFAAILKENQRKSPADQTKTTTLVQMYMIEHFFQRGTQYIIFNAVMSCHMSSITILSNRRVPTLRFAKIRWHCTGLHK